jgi:pimeloyl-ACP methyl ester carboxylesterase
MGNERHPAVVFLHGSGSEGRYAGRFLAEYLTRYGIAALIFDKRGVGKSTGDWKHSTFDDLADDAIAGINLLRQRDDINATKIGIYGHSQGGMIAPLVATKSKGVAFIISGAGSSVPVYESEINSLVNQLRVQGIQGGDLDEAVVFVRMFVEVLRSGENRKQFEAAATKAQTKKWYPMLHVPARDDWQWAFFKSIYNYNAADSWSKVSVPTLVIYGERDLYVPVAQSVAAIDRALNQAGNKDYTILVLPRASHAFNLESEIGKPFEWQRLAPGFPDLLIAWITLRVRRID